MTLDPAGMLSEILEAAFDRATDPEFSRLRLLALTSVLLELLEESGDASDPRVAYFKTDELRPAAECHGFALDTDDDLLTLYFVIDSTATVPFGHPVEPQSTSKDLVERSFKRLAAFADYCSAGKLDNIEPSSPASEMVALVREHHSRGLRLELSVITTGLVSARAAVPDSGDNRSRSVWDLPRLARTCAGKDHEGVIVDFVAALGAPLPCLATPEVSPDIRVFMTWVPATFLGSIYNQYRGRLLETNIRSFLQFTSKVNGGIRETLIGNPDRFVAYNNGLSATASSAEIESASGALALVRRVHDFQIVNGGQTTASIAACIRREGMDLGAVAVPMKLTIVPPDRVDTLVPKITEFANTQNRIQTADLLANHPWHVEFERISRAVWIAPSQEAPRGTRWFYERSRGQYADELASQKTPAGKKRFRTENPTRQKIVKTDIAKYVLAWDQDAPTVCLGAQKCFAALMKRFRAEHRPLPDEGEFRRIIALAVLFRRAEKLYGEMKFTGYRAQVVAHSIAYLSHKLSRRLPFDKIWDIQALPSDIESALKSVLEGVRESLLSGAGKGNVTEWSKKEACWRSVQALEIVLPPSLGTTPGSEPQPGASSGVFTAQHLALIALVQRVPDAVWFEVSGWAKSTGSLVPWQRSLSFSLGGLRARGKSPSIKQAVQGRRLLLEAYRLGFSHPELELQLVSELQAWTDGPANAGPSVHA